MSHSLSQLQERMRGIEDREDQLQEKQAEHKRAVDEFYNVNVAQITSRHKQELAELEKLAARQLKVNFLFCSSTFYLKSTCAFIYCVSRVWTSNDNNFSNFQFVIESKVFVFDDQTV